MPVRERERRNGAWDCHLDGTRLSAWRQVLVPHERASCWQVLSECHGRCRHQQRPCCLRRSVTPQIPPTTYIYTPIYNILYRQTGLPKDWRRRPGRPRHTWLRTLNADLHPLNHGLNSAWRLAQDRERWRQLVETAMLQPGARSWWWCTDKHSLNQRRGQWLGGASPPTDVIWAVVIVWRIRVKIIRTVQCCIVYHNCTQL